MSARSADATEGSVIAFRFGLDKRGAIRGTMGFDVLLCGALARTAWLAWRRSPFVVNVASATAALLVVDAWFDVTTSPGGQDLVVSAATARERAVPGAGSV